MDEKLFLLELARQIKIARMRTGKTQLEVLHETHIHIGRIEQGDQSIQLITFYRLCKYLGISPEEIISNISYQLSFNDIRVIGRN